MPFRAVDLLGNSRLKEPAVSCREINWQKCVICQDDKSGEKLCHSNNSNNCAVETGYFNFAIKLHRSHELGMCFRPICADVDLVWPRCSTRSCVGISCYLKYELSRAKECKAQTDLLDAARLVKHISN